MTPCEEMGCFPGMFFEFDYNRVRGIAFLAEDDGSKIPLFQFVRVFSEGDCNWVNPENNQTYCFSSAAHPLFPVEEYPDLVWVEGIYDIPVQIPRELLHKLCLENHWLHESLSKSLFRITR